MLPNLIPPKIPDGERVDFDVSKITIATPQCIETILVMIGQDPV